MVVQALNVIRSAFQACTSWVSQLFGAVDGAGVVLAAICIVISISLLFMPIRGIGVNVGALHDYAFQAVHQPKSKYGSGKRVLYGGSSGKFSRPDRMRSRGGHKK